jgi:hypothetical protein
MARRTWLFSGARGTGETRGEKATGGAGKEEEGEGLGFEGIKRRKGRTHALGLLGGGPAGKRRSRTRRAWWKTRIEERAFPARSRKKKYAVRLHRKEWTQGRLQPVFVPVFPKTKKKKNRENRNMRGGENFANKFQQYFEILIFGTKQLL